MSEQIKEALREALPPIFGKASVPDLIPGLELGWLNNAICKHSGPDGSFRVGRKLFFQREPFIDWLTKNHLYLNTEFPQLTRRKRLQKEKGEKQLGKD